MNSKKNSISSLIFCIFLFSVSITLFGCGGGSSSGTPASSSVIYNVTPAGGAGIIGATVNMYEVGNSMSFPCTATSGCQYNCTISPAPSASAVLYVTVSGGYADSSCSSGTPPSSSVASDILLSKVDIVSSIQNRTIPINEFTTVAATYALEQSGYPVSGSGAPTTVNGSSLSGLIGVINSVDTYLPAYETGSSDVSPSSSTPSGETTNMNIIADTFSTLANAMASCVNSVNSPANTNPSQCATLFTASGSNASNTMDAAVNAYINLNQGSGSAASNLQSLASSSNEFTSSAGSGTITSSCNIPTGSNSSSGGGTSSGGSSTGGLSNSSSGGGISNSGSSNSGSSTSSQPSYSVIYQDFGTPTYDPDNGMFYGTAMGGANGNGQIFELNPVNNTFATLFSFTNVDGEMLAGLTYDPDNKMFYGTTKEQNLLGYVGTIFKFDPSSNTETTVYSFPAVNNWGQLPSVLTYDPSNKMFYATSYDIGANSDGVIYQFDPSSNTFTTVYSFTGAGDGKNPSALTYDPSNGMLYGTTFIDSSNGGTIFKFDPSSNTETPLYNFSGEGNGYGYSASGLTYDPSNKMFYGVAISGGTHNDGMLFAFNPSSNAETLLYSFTGAEDGESPANLTYDPSNGMLYGTAGVGGTNGDGTIYVFDPSSNTFTTLYSFSSTDGEPMMWLVYVPSTGMFYGATNVNISYSHGGSIFEFNP